MVKSNFYIGRDSTIGNILSEYLKCKNDLLPQTAHLLFSADRWQAQLFINRDLGMILNSHSVKAFI